MIALDRVAKAYGPRTLFAEASFRLLAGDRIGLVGPNGAGKTTLFRIIQGEEEPDEGGVTLERGARIGFLPQESAPVGEETVLELAASVTAEIAQLYEKARQHPAVSDPAHLEAQARLAELGVPRIEAAAKKVLAGLAFREEDYNRPAQELSGGWVMRAHLARLLVMEPEVLLLDEPTNHLDLETLGWFQQQLTQQSGTLLVISHDRAFLNAICSRILEVRHQKLHTYTGNYNDFLRQRQERLDQHRAAYQAQQREIAQIETFINRFRAKNTKATQVQSRIKYLDKLERIPPPEGDEKTVHFRFPQPERSGQRIAQVEHVEQAYGDHVVYRDLNLNVEKGQRTVLVGPNGAGKSTLLKILAGVVPIQAGTVTLGHQVSVGYFSQQRTETLDPAQTVLEEATGVGAGLPEVEVRKLLGAFLFRGDDAFKRISVLSGGEKSRLALVKLLLNPPNFLLLDEPTTHLDIASIDALLGALQAYAGTLLFVSHDVHFIRQLATSVLHVDAGVITPYAGDYDYYLYKTGAADARQAVVSGLSNARPGAETSAKAPGNSSDRKGQRRQAARQREERKALQVEVSRLEREIERLENRQRKLASQLADPAVYRDEQTARELRREAMDLEEKLAQTNEIWEAKAEELLDKQEA